MNKIFKYYFYGTVTIIFILIYLISFKDYQFTPIENYNFMAGVGFDINTSLTTDKYEVPVSVYEYNPDGSVSSFLLDAIGSSTVEARIDRQLHSGKSFCLGTEKTYVFSKEISYNGIAAALDGLLNNTQVPNRALFVTTSNSPKDILALNIPGYPSSPDYIDGLMSSLKVHTFYTGNSSLFDAYVNNRTEGKKFVAPNIDIINNKLYLTAFSIFNNGKMIASVPVSSMINFNLLRNNKCHGLLNYTENSKNFLTFTTSSKRKVVCKKKDNKFFFDIYIEASGKIVNNNYMNNLSISLDQKYALEKRIATHYETSLQSFVDNMKSYYKVDLLDLGFVAASKYGRNLISDWDETVTTSPIKVHFKFSIDEFGIGNMTF